MTHADAMQLITEIKDIGLALSVVGLAICLFLAAMVAAIGAKK